DREDDLLPFPWGRVVDGLRDRQVDPRGARSASGRRRGRGVVIFRLVVEFDLRRIALWLLGESMVEAKEREVLDADAGRLGLVRDLVAGRCLDLRHLIGSGRQPRDADDAFGLILIKAAFLIVFDVETLTPGTIHGTNPECGAAEELLV